MAVQASYKSQHRLLAEILNSVRNGPYVAVDLKCVCGCGTHGTGDAD